MESKNAVKSWKSRMRNAWLRRGPNNQKVDEWPECLPSGRQVTGQNAGFVAVECLFLRFVRLASVQLQIQIGKAEFHNVTVSKIGIIFPVNRFTWALTVPFTAVFIAILLFNLPVLFLFGQQCAVTPPQTSRNQHQTVHISRCFIHEKGRSKRSGL